MGFLEALTLIFIILKVLGIITWSWWLVIAPMYLAITVYLIILMAFGTGVFLTISSFFK